MRTLVAVTCLAILAAISYYFWNEYRQHAEAVQLAEDMRAHRIEQLARDAKRAECEPMVKRYVQAKTYKDLVAPDVIDPCWQYFTVSEIDTWKAQVP